MALLHVHPQNGLSSATGLYLTSSPTSKSLRRPSFVSCPKKIAGLCMHGNRLIVLSVSTVEPLRRPYLPPDSLVSSKPSTLISERVFSVENFPGRKMTFKYAKQPSSDFCTFIENTPKLETVAFFRDIVGLLERYYYLRDFHLKIRDGYGGFRVVVHYGEDRFGPEPLAPEACIACFPNIPLYPEQDLEMKSKECILEEFSDQTHVVCRLDAKGRSGFAIAPVRHVERMTELNDDEVFALWSSAVRVLRHAKLPFISMILNHGLYRTVDHLLLKVWVENDLYQDYTMSWSEERKEMWKRLQILAMNRPKKQQLCLFHARNKCCRHGDYCSYLHIEQSL